MKNPTKLVDELYARFDRVPGFRRFLQTVGILADLSSTPGWHDKDGKPTSPGAKAIGRAQWGDAQMVAGLITEAAHGAPWPEPGIDTDDAGFILLQWQIADNAQLDLEYRHGSNHKRYRWTMMREGIRSERYASDDPQDVVASLRAVMVGARRVEARVA